MLKNSFQSVRSSSWNKDLLLLVNPYIRHKRYKTVSLMNKRENRLTDLGLNSLTKLNIKKPWRSRSRMPVLSWDGEEDVPECSGWKISQIFFVKYPVPGKWHAGTQTSSKYFAFWIYSVSLKLTLPTSRSYLQLILKQWKLKGTDYIVNRKEVWMCYKFIWKFQLLHKLFYMGHCNTKNGFVYFDFKSSLLSISLMLKHC